MDSSTEPAYGLWSLVIINSLVFIIFAFSFAKPQTSRDWRSVPIETDIGKLDAAAPLTVGRRGKPVWISHGTDEMLRLNLSPRGV